VGLLIVLLVVGLLTGGSSPTASTHKSNASRNGHTGGAGAAGRPSRALARTQLASLRVQATAEVYVCLIGDGGRKRIPGLILKPGGSPSPEYHARRFLLTLGNNAVTLTVNGTTRAVPPSSGAIGYAITRTGMRTLASGEQPTCK
jgi:hypothetical protein